MKTIEKKRLFLIDIASGNKTIQDFNLKTFEPKELSLEMVSNENLEWIIYICNKYSSQMKNNILSTSVLTPDELTKYREVEKQFIYK